jgi:GTP cyclohydrolase I
MTAAAALEQTARLHVVHDGSARDADRARDAAEAFLRALGVPVDDPGLEDTPRRMVDAYTEMLTPRPFDLTTFPNDEGYDELVLARGIPVQSVCEHHMLPFTGIAHVGYLPGGRIVGLSKLARVAPRGVGVVIEAEHLCMTLRGVQAPGTTTITSALQGVLREDPRSRAEFLSLTGRP